MRPPRSGRPGTQVSSAHSQAVPGRPAQGLEQSCETVTSFAVSLTAVQTAFAPRALRTRDVLSAGRAPAAGSARPAASAGLVGRQHTRLPRTPSPSERHRESPPVAELTAECLRTVQAAADRPLSLGDRSPVSCLETGWGRGGVRGVEVAPGPALRWRERCSATRGLCFLSNKGLGVRDWGLLFDRQRRLGQVRRGRGRGVGW